MPVVSLYYDDLEELSGVDRGMILERLPMLGCEIEKVEEDYVDVEFFPNRPDLYSVEGVARALRGFFGVEMGLKAYRVGESGVSVVVDAGLAGVRPALGCAVVRGVDLTSRLIEELMNFQEDLHWGLGRNRRKASIGIHDLGVLEPPFHYTTAPGDLRFTPLDSTRDMSIREILGGHPKGVKFAHILEGFDRYPIILDATGGVVSFPPIINSSHTRLTPGRRDVFIEVTGLDSTVYVFLNIVVCALAERGGSIEAVEIQDGITGETRFTPDLTPQRWELDPGEVGALLGIEISPGEIVELLQRMGHQAEIRGGRVSVQVAPYRADILHAWDLVEDIAIGRGYDTFQPEFPQSRTLGSSHPVSDFKRMVRELMVGLGYYQVMPFTLTSERVQYKLLQREPGGFTRIENPISEEHTILRTSLLPGLLEILSLNKHRELPQQIFEVGEVVEDGVQQVNLAAVKIHAQANYTEMRSTLDTVMRELELDYRTGESRDPAFLPGRRADIHLGENTVGVVGEIHPQVILNFGLEHPITAFEITLARGGWTCWM